MCLLNFANPCKQPAGCILEGGPVLLDDEVKSSVTDKLDDFEHVNHALYSWYISLTISVSFTSALMLNVTIE